MDLKSNPVFKLTTLKPFHSHTPERQKSVKSERIKSHLTINEEEIQKSSSSHSVLKSRTTLQPFHREEKLRKVKKGRKMAKRNKFVKNHRARKVYARKQAKCDQQNLEECVDGCTKVEDILEYSGCVVQCSEVC